LVEKTGYSRSESLKEELAKANEDIKLVDKEIE
jgi:hypothetical protein